MKYLLSTKSHRDIYYFNDLSSWAFGLQTPDWINPGTEAERDSSVSDMVVDSLASANQLKRRESEMKT